MACAKIRQIDFKNHYLFTLNMKSKQPPSITVQFEKKSWIQYHIDGNNRNNSPINLVLVPQEVYMTVKYSDTGATHRYEIMKKNKGLLLHKNIVPDKRGRMEFDKKFLLTALWLHREKRDKIMRSKIKRDRVREIVDGMGLSKLRNRQTESVPIAKQLTLDL